MNKNKLSLILLTAALLMIAIPGFAFHKGSELVCNNCHTMHYSEGGFSPSTTNGYPVEADSGGPFPVLLVKDNVTDICLSCHGNAAAGGIGYAGAPIVYYKGAAGTAPLQPGGDFAYSAQGLTGNAATATVGKGHNPAGKTGFQSAHFDIDNLNGGATGLIPPGNNNTAVVDARFVCTSCHDAHGPVSGSSQIYPFRMLLKTPNNVSPLSTDSILSIAWSNPSTAGPDGADLTVSESSTNQNVYKGGFSAWCSSCHPKFHGSSKSDTDVGDGTDWIRHPTQYAIGSSYAANYGTNYDVGYPLIKVGGAWTKTATGAIAQTDEVFCLSCHKAHASANANAVRWDHGSASALGQCNKCHKQGGGV